MKRKEEMKKTFSILILLFLTNCFGPTLTTLGPYNVTITDLLTAPNKINNVDKYINKEKGDKK
jgi:hypothetical protein